MRLSVVVTVVDGGETLDRCLASLTAQRQAPDLEVIVPWDATIPAVGNLAARFPHFQFPALGDIKTDRPPASAAGQHELSDRRRSAGLAQAAGDIVAVLEDRGVPRDNWARALVDLHTRLPHAVIGGAIENRSDALLNWAVYFCDFGRFQRPFEAGPRAWVSDINIGYKRRALDATRALWRERYHETTVHWALTRAGETLFLSPEPVVEQWRGTLRLGALLTERVAWGRLFACTRARESGPARRIALTLLTPFLPILLFGRHTGIQLHRRGRIVTFVRASPVVVLLLIAWSLGEAIGYFTAEA